MATKKSHVAAGLYGDAHTPATGFANVNVGTTERIISAAGGALLTYYGLRERQASKPLGLGLAALGTCLILRGASGYCPVNQLVGRDSAQHSPSKAIKIVQTFTINRPVAEVYGFWRRLENLPQFMQHIESVEQLDERRSHWKANIPGGLLNVEWEAEIVNDEPNLLLAWQSLPGSEVDNAGEVRFLEAPGDKGTEVQAVIHYRAPAGALGHGVAQLLNPALEEMVRSDLRRFKQLMEAGEITTIAGQPSGRGRDKG
ncbi:SRPBCC family protein [Hymenobacter terrenus]|uniref:SRPBCC family protein n=1 Tax=Hymenobacter terrenus TaxID=1629124 RepID=UPI000619662D|nr:SRPBCC family protein [Hymenobacter terrenus]